MKENDIYEGKIIDDNLNGNGILKIKKFSSFCPLYHQRRLCKGKNY